MNKERYEQPYYLKGGKDYYCDKEHGFNDYEALVVDGIIACPKCNRAEE